MAGCPDACACLSQRSPRAGCHSLESFHISGCYFSTSIFFIMNWNIYQSIQKTLWPCDTLKKKKKKSFLGMRLGGKVSMVSMDQFVGLQVVPLSSVWFFNPYPHVSVSSFPNYRLSLFQLFLRVNFLYYPDWGKLRKPMEDSVSKLWFIHQIWPAACFC